MMAGVVVDELQSGVKPWKPPQRFPFKIQSLIFVISSVVPSPREKSAPLHIIDILTYQLRRSQSLHSEKSCKMSLC